METKLTAKQARFVEEYLVDLNATQAAVRSGYSVRTAKAIGYENLRKPQVADAIQVRQKQLAVASGVTPERTLKEVERCAFVDPRRMFDQEGNLIPIRELDTESAAAIGSFEVTRHKDGGVTTKVKMVNKLEALDKIGKHLGMWSVEKKGGDEDLVTALREGRERAARR
ncbi:MAG: terminase small subunit [Magnetococcales bacterium]|nr:terminase small subunit [Magnetococcales bacterium]